MIDSIDLQLQDWAQALYPDAVVTFVPPLQGEAIDTPRIHLYLLHVVPGLTRAMSPTQGAVSELRLRYLVTVDADEPTVAHRVLGELAFAALESLDYELDLEPLSADFWQALGVVPQPSIVLRISLRRDRPLPEAPVVREPLVLERADIASLTGRIAEGDNIPLSGATVEIPSLRLRQTTDPNGRFYFPTVPAAHKHQLRIRARGREMTATVEPQSGQPVIIQFNPSEEEG